MCRVKNLRYVQLYNADFNLFHQFMFDKEAMTALTKNRFLPEEHFSQRDSIADDAKLDKTLTVNLSRQARHPTVTAPVEATQYYDKVNHVILSLVRHALIGTLGPIAGLLACLQTMRFFQRTGFSDPVTFLDGGHLSKYLIELGQGSRGTPLFRIQLSSVTVNVLISLDHGSMIINPLTRNIVHTVGYMFVDSTDLYCWEESLKMGEALFTEIQEGTNAWRDLLITARGCLKPEQCFWYLLDYGCVI